MKVHNRRKFHRINFDGFASVEFINGRCEFCQINNLSLTGMCVTGNFGPTLPKNCFIKVFHNEKTGNNCLIATARIVWKKNEKIGLKFTSMTLENYELLRATLSENAEEPMLILREIPNKYPFKVSHHL